MADGDPAEATLHQRIGRALVELARPGEPAGPGEPGEPGEPGIELDGDAVRVLARVELAEGVSSVGIFVHQADDTYRYVLDHDDVVFDLFDELHALAEAGGTTWSQATCTVDAQGQISFLFGAADVTDWGESAARREAWMAKHLGPHPTLHWT